MLGFINRSRKDFNNPLALKSTVPLLGQYWTLDLLCDAQTQPVL